MNRSKVHTEGGRRVDARTTRPFGLVPALLWVVVGLIPSGARAVELPGEASADQVILFVLEGVGQDAVKVGAMPVLKGLAKDGSVTWSATAVLPASRLPTMASVLMGLPVEKHGVTWETFDYARGYPRPPTLFDYLDLSGGRDSTIFFMDESLRQLAKPEPYTDYQLCGALRPECTPELLVKYIRDYFAKATSGEGYGHAIFSLPHLLVVHLPEAGREGTAHGWTSKEYRGALGRVDRAMGDVLTLYKDLKLLARTTVLVTSLSPAGANGSGVAPRVLWLASGSGVKRGHVIAQPVSIMDTGATVMRTLGLETYTEWDSHAVEEIFRTPRPVANSRNATVGQVHGGMP